MENNEIKPQYLVQQPNRLERLAMLKLAEWIRSQAEMSMSLKSHVSKFMQFIQLFTRHHKQKRNKNNAEATLLRHTENIRNALCKIPGFLHDEISNEAIRVLSELAEKTKLALKAKYIGSRQRNAILRVTEALFTESLTILLINYSNVDMLRDSLFSKSYILPGIIRLELRFAHGYLGTIDETNVIRMLKRLPGLKYVTLKTICTDNILRCVADNCKMIEELNLIFSSTINDTSIDILTELSNLRNVSLCGTAVTKNGIAVLLKSCVNVVDFSSNTIACALEHIASSKENAGIELKLKTYLNHRNTTKEQLKLVVNMCPEIQNVDLIKHHKLLGSLVVLNDLQDLKKITLENFDFYADQVKEVLEKIGHTLVHLYLKKVNQMDLNALMFLCQMCPRLQSLSIEECILESDRVLNTKAVLTNPQLRCLKRLVVHAIGWQSQSIQEQLLFLLSTCPNVEIITTSVLLTDDIMIKVLDRNPLTCLVNLQMLCSNLTESVLDRLTKNCIKPPEVINYHLCQYNPRIVPII